MTLVVDSTQLTLSKRGAIEVVPLVVLETFSDRDAQAVASTRYWTRTGRRLRYRWDGVTAVTFEPVIDELSPADRGFSHLPDASEFATRATLRLEIESAPRAGVYLWKALLDENIVGARVTVASLLVDPDVAATDLSVVPGFTTAVHVVRFRGEVTLLSSIRAEGTAFSLVVESQETKLGASVFLPGEISGDLPVILDTAANIELIPTSVRHSGRFVEQVAGVRYSIILDSGSVAPNLPPDAYFQDWVSPSGVSRDNRWMAMTQNGARSDGFAYESVTAPGVNGAPEIDLAYPEGEDAVAVVDDPVYLPKYAMKWAIAAGYVRNLTRLRLSSRSARFADSDLVSTLGYQWTIKHDETDPNNVVSFLFVTPSGIAAFPTNYLHAELCWHEDVFFEADIGSMLDTPAGVFSTAVDVATWPIGNAGFFTMSRGTGYGANVESARVWSGNVSDADMTAALVAGYIVVTSTAPGPIYPLGTACVFKQLGISAGDKQFEITINFAAGEIGKVARVWFVPSRHLGGPITAGFGDQTVRHGARMIEASELSTGDNTFRFHGLVANQADAIDRLSIFVIWNEDTTNKVFSIKANITQRALTEAIVANHPADIVELVVDTYLPSSTLTVDAASFATAKTNTPGIAVTPDLALYPSLGEFLAAVGFAGRINFVFAEGSSGTVLKAFAAESDYDFGAVVRAIGSEFTSMIVTLKPLTEIANHFSWLYNLAEGESPDFIENYLGSLRVTPETNPYSPDVTTLEFTDNEAAFGDRESIAIPIPMIRDETSMLETTGYYVSEALRGQVQRLTCLVPFWVGYDLEPGDILSVLPAWESANQKVRIVRTVFSFNQNGVGLVLESVT